MSERLKFYVLAAIVTISVTTIAFIYSYEVEELDNKRLQTKIEELTQEKEKLEKAIKELDSSTPGIYKPHLKDIITSTLAYIGEKNLLDWTKLIYLTIATESNLGKYSKQLKGPAKGITQVEPSTETTVLNWINKHNPKIYNKIKNLRVHAKLDIHEAEYNLAYSISLAYLVYKMRNVNPKKCSTENLAKLYKKHYNTYKGKATVENVLTKLIAYNIKL